MHKITLKQTLKSIYPAVYTLQSIKSRLFHPTRIAVIFISSGLFLSFITFYIFVIKDLPSPSSLSTINVPQTTHIRDRHGTELYKIYLSQNRTLIKLSQLPLQVKQAIIAIEDKNFYSHRGFSTRGTLRAFTNNLVCLFTSNCPIQGGSTITQQLVKTSLLTSERSLQRKLRELVLAIAVELIYSKDQILEMYLNRVGFGGATYGIEEASQTYFGISSRNLNLAQAAFLAGLPASPTTFSPYGTHPELAKARQKEVLGQMSDANFITWDQAASAAAEPIQLQAPTTNILAAHFVMYVKELLAKEYGDELVEQGGLNVTTTLDLDLQLSAEKIVSAELAKISNLHVGNGAVLVTRPNTGEILVMIGSKDYFDLKNDGNVNVTLSPRQPGSAIKPVSYALAFLKGFTPATIISDTPVTYSVTGQPPYTPINYDRSYHGKVSIRTALASSFNIPAVKVLSTIGVNNLLEFAKTLGITTWDDPSRFGLALTLGGGEVKMTELSTAYGVFANGGYRVDLNPILEVRDHLGHILESSPCRTGDLNPICNRTSVLDPQVAFLISDILSDNIARSPTFGLYSQLNIPGSPVAVKTGTTNNLRDNWTIGYTPDFLAAVWVGNNDNTPMSYVASGVTGASPIWRQITDLLLKKYPSSGFTPPANLVKVSICPATGQLSCSSCPGRFEYFLSGTQPKSACTDESINTVTRPKDHNRDRILNGAFTQR